MDDLYREEILEHYHHPHNQGKLTGEGVLKRRAANAGCGDDIEAELLIKDGRVKDLKWHGTGCAISQAAMSVVSDWAIGKTLTEIKKADTQEVLKLMGLTDVSINREKCASLPLQLFQER